jgi:NAD(P)-dependent dehydrogenase (short-subunit alcohol dehydrogenase family)
MGSASFLPRASIISDSTLENIQNLALSHKAKATYHQLNVTDVDNVKPVFEKICSELRHPLRGLVACAGISGEADAVDYPIDVFRKIVDVNVTGTMVVCQEAAREMHRAGVTGSMVIIASMSGWIVNRVCLQSSLVLLLRHPQYRISFSDLRGH